MIAEAIDTVITLGWAFAVWILLCAVAVGLALYTVVVTVWAVGRLIWRMLRAARGAAASRKPQAPVSRPEGPSRDSRILRAAPKAPQTPSRPAPTWARTDTGEAA